MSIQIKKKFIKSQAIDGGKVLFLNEDSFKALKSNGDVAELFKFSNGDKLVMLQMPQVSSDPVADEDLARKKYVDDSLNVEMLAREAGDETLQENIDAEEARAEGEEARIEGKLDAEIANRIAAVVAETAAREAAITAEQAARIAGDAAEQAAREAAIADERSSRESADAGLDAGITQALNAIAAETAARQVGDENLNSALDLEVAARVAGDLAEAAAREAAITAEVARATAAEAGLQSAINTEKGRVDAILLASEADKDSFAEIVQLINSVDTENDSAFASYVLSNNAALAAESAARSAADSALQSEVDAEETRALAAESALDARLDVLEADPVTKTYVDGKVSELTSDIVDLDGYAQDIRSDLDDLDGYAQEIRSDLDQEILDRAAADSAEQAARIAGDNALQSSLNTEIANRQAAVSAEEAARIAGDSELASDLAAEEAARIAGDAALQSSLNTEVANRIAAVSSEAAAREAADDVLDAKIDQKHSEALSYTDSKVAALVNSAPEVLDTLKELADALGGDENFATSIAGQIGAETAAREAADAALDARLDALEGSGAGSLAFELNTFGERMVSESFEVDASMISSGYLELGFKAFAPSMVVSLDRLMLFEGEDFVVSVVGGKTQLTFAGSILPMGDEALASGDKIKVRYLKDVR